jgi:alpha-beta hydrolase superfamily lysophospholipase
VIDVPTLWIHGENDRLVPLAETRTGIEAIRGRDLTERTYPAAEHEIFNELNKDEVLADTLSFLDHAVTPR